MKKNIILLIFFFFLMPNAWAAIDDEFDYENLKIKLVELDNHRVIKFECKVVELVEDSEEVSTNE